MKIIKVLFLYVDFKKYFFALKISVTRAEHGLPKDVNW